MQAMNLQAVAAATGGRILCGRPDLELTGISTDTRTLKPGDLYFALVGEHHDAHAFLPEAARRGARAAVVHHRAVQSRPGLALVLVDDTTRTFGDLARWHRRQCPTTVIGITGSNGKTTTKEMLYHILYGVVRSIRSPKSYNNAVGVPLTLFQMRPDAAYAVVEMGTNSPGEIERLCEVADPDVGLLTNATATHLAGLGSVEGVAREKSALLKHTARRGGSFYNADDYWSRRIAKRMKGHFLSFGVENEADLRAFHLRSNGAGIRFKLIGGPRIRLGVPGEHNARNALAAIAVARKLGIDWNTIADRLATFVLPPMRMEVVRAAGVALINDAYNANPVSMDAAARTLRHLECAGRKILVVGDMHELGPSAAEMHRAVGQTVAGYRFDYLLGIGSNTAELLGAAAERGMDEQDLHLAGSKEELADVLLDLVEAGDTVLFKGSRAAALEDVVGRVRNGLGAGAPIHEEPALPRVGQHDPIADGAPALGTPHGNAPVARTVG